MSGPRREIFAIMGLLPTSRIFFFFFYTFIKVGSQNVHYVKNKILLNIASVIHHLGLIKARLFIRNTMTKNSTDENGMKIFNRNIAL
jgi:hypothetical protein